MYRDELFVLFDEWQEHKDKNRIEKNERDLIITDGADEDRQARFEDYIQTKEGRHEHDRKLIKELLLILQDKYPPREAMTMAEAQKV